MKKTMEMVHGILDRRSVSANIVGRRLETLLNTFTQNNVFKLQIIWNNWIKHSTHDRDGKGRICFVCNTCTLSLSSKLFCIRESSFWISRKRKVKTRMNGQSFTIQMPSFCRVFVLDMDWFVDWAVLLTNQEYELTHAHSERTYCTSIRPKYSKLPWKELQENNQKPQDIFEVQVAVLD